jgi:hypothetical protein
MALVPVFAGNRIRLANLPANATDRDKAWWQDEQVRRTKVVRRRMYYDGEQYDAENVKAMLACHMDPMVDRLPEHQRLHAYSTQIGEAVDFIADQLASGFMLVAKDAQVQEVVDQMVANTDTLSGGDDDEKVEINCDEPLAEALKAGDSPYRVCWDPIEQQPFLELWDSEQITFVNPFGSLVTKVIREEVVWVIDEQGDDRQVTQRMEYHIVTNEFGQDECVEDEYWDAEEAYRSREFLGIPLIPWGLLRGMKKSLRAYRGDSVITSKAMDAADRYDAVEQTAWLIARYNSHGNLVVIGDGAEIQVESAGKVEKDVADVLTFPTGTQAVAMVLPTDPQMIEHQRKVLAESIYQTFGLTRVEAETLEGLGAISGYALEILNRKSEGTFRRIRRQWRKDWHALLDLLLDVTAYKQQAKLQAVFEGVITEVDLEDPDFRLPLDAVVSVAFWEIDPDEVFPNRVVEIRMGSAFIVDDVAIRDDFTAKLIDQKTALKQRGYDDDEIKEIFDATEAAKPKIEDQLALQGRIDPNTGKTIGAGSLTDTNRPGATGPSGAKQ